MQSRMCYQSTYVLLKMLQITYVLAAAKNQTKVPMIYLGVNMNHLLPKYLL